MHQPRQLSSPIIFFSPEMLCFGKAVVQIRHHEASAQAATTDRMPRAYDAGDAFGAKLRGRKIGRTMPLSIPRNTRHGVEGSVPPAPELFRCAIYTHKSTEHNFDLEFNSLDAQRRQKKPGPRGLPGHLGPL